MRQLLFLIAFAVASSVTYAQEVPFKVAYADIEYILARIPDMQELNEKLKSTQTQLQGDYEAKQAQFQKQYQNYAESMKTMTDTVRANAERELQLLNNEIQQFPQEAKNTLDNTRRLWMAPMYLKIGNAIESVAVENGYSIIIPSKVNGIELLLYSDVSRDVSKLVLAKFGVAPDPEEKK
jgi:outer membrane protein